ncbi:hypothetical protein SAMN05216327_12318 [Dyadobacter sp. SG02]|nr:hypothetical protein SAMN05216327_12318 [Dyadobacter sp. SG02]
MAVFLNSAPSEFMRNQAKFTNAADCPIKHLRHPESGSPYIVDSRGQYVSNLANLPAAHLKKVSSGQNQVVNKSGHQICK